jgi:WD40 repeat protein
MTMADRATNPYVGPQPFKKEQASWFFGRDGEIRELSSLIVAHREVVLHSQSGAGKTSLLNAGVFPRLEERGFEILPPARVLGPPSDVERPSQSISNIFTYNVLSSWSVEDHEKEHLDTLSVANYLENQKIAGEPKSRLRIIILDQFEELFTAYPDRWQDRRAFLEQIAEALDEDKRLRVVFAIRDEHVALLRGFAAIFPEGLRTWFHLERLRREPALDAVVRPAESTARTYNPEAADELVEQLLSIQVRAGTDRATQVEGEFAEPVQLQIVCRRLWEDLPPDVARIEKRHIETFSDVNEALIQYYAATVSEVSANTGIRKHRIRRWFEKELITEAGTRSIVYRGSQSTGGLPNPVVDELQKRYLLRAELRAGANWYELPHDRFIEPIRLARQREQKRLRPLKAALVVIAILIVLLPLGLLLQARYKERSRQAEAVKLATTEALQEQDDGKRLRIALRAGWLAYPFRDQEEFRHSAAEIKDVLQGAVNSVPVATGKPSTESQLLSKQIGRIQASAFSSNGDVVALWENPNSSAKRGWLRLWNTASLKWKSSISSKRIKHGHMTTINKEGTRVAILDRAGVVWYRERETRRDLAPFYSPNRPGLVAIDFSPEGSLIATVGWDGMVGIWDVHPRNPVPKLSEHKGRAGTNPPVLTDGVWDVAFNPDASILATASSDGTVTLWDMEKGAAPRTLKGHSGEVRRVAFSPDGETLATASWDHTVRVWKVESGTELHTLGGHTRPVNGVVFDPSGTWIASGASDGTIKIWNVANGKLLKTLRGHRRSVRDVAFSPDGRWIASASVDKTAKIWNVETGMVEHTLKGHSQTVWSVVFNDTGTQVATASKDGTAKVWDAGSGKEEITLAGHFSTALNEAVFALSGNYIVTVGDDATCRWWNLETQEDTLCFGEGNISAIALNPEGTKLAAAWEEGKIILLATDPMRQYHLLERPESQGKILRIIFSADGRYLATANKDGTVRIWDAKSPSREILSTLSIPGRAFQTVAFSPEGTWVATSGGGGRSPLVWNIASGEKREMKDGEGDEFRDITLSPLGELVATVTETQIRMWSVGTRLPILSLSLPAEHLRGVSFTSDGQYLVAVGSEKLYRYRTGDFYQRDLKTVMTMAFERLPGALNSGVAKALRGDFQEAIVDLEKIPSDSPDRVRADQLTRQLQTGEFTPLVLQEVLKE